MSMYGASLRPPSAAQSGVAGLSIDQLIQMVASELRRIGSAGPPGPPGAAGVLKGSPFYFVQTDPGLDSDTPTGPYVWFVQDVDGSLLDIQTGVK